MSSKEIYEKIFRSFVIGTKRFKEVWLSHNKKSIRDIFQFGDDDFFMQSFMLDRLNCSSIDMTLEILRQLFELYNIDVYWWPKRYSAHLSNPGFLYNFIIRNLNGKSVAYRVEEDICCEEEKYVEDWLKENKISELIVVHLNYPYSIQMNDSDMINVTDFQSFFLKFFGENEWDCFSVYLEKCLDEVKDIIGFKTVSFLSSMNLKKFKEFVSDELCKFQYKKMHYQVVDHLNEKTKKHIKLESMCVDEKDLSIIDQRFTNDSLYKIMIGNSNFAKSFLTSEWLYHSLRGKPHFDYTAIISGYAKALEQLLHTIVLMSIDKQGLYISLSRNIKESDLPSILKSQIIKEVSSNNNTYYYIPLVKDSVEYIDDSLWALQTFLNRNSWYLKVKGNSARMIYDMIDCFRKESRNEYFHKENLYNWDVVEKTRLNAIYLYYLILGSYPLDKNEYDFLRKEGYDKFDELCKKIREFHERSINFVMKFNNDEQEINAIYDIRSNSIEFNDEGIEHYEGLKFIKVNDFSNKTYEDISKGIITEYFYISRQNMPCSVYGVERSDNIISIWQD